MEQQILEKLQKQEQKIEQIYVSVEKTRKYFLWTLIATIVTVVLPLIGLVIVIPILLKSLTSALSL